MRRSRRALSMFLASLLVVTVMSVTGAQPASADATGLLATAQGNCLEPGSPPDTIPCYDMTQLYWELKIVAWVGDSPRYSVRNLYFNTCLVAFASSGNVGTYRCNSAWADQVWAFQYVKHDAYGYPLYWLRNKHSGRCLALNASYRPQAFMTTCAQYNDQLWHAPGPY
jgi:hypothetical protein